MFRLRPAPKGQVAAHDLAVRVLHAVGFADRACGLRSESPQYLAANRNVNELRAGLSPLQRSAMATQLRLDLADLRSKKRARAQ